MWSSYLLLVCKTLAPASIMNLCIIAPNSLGERSLASCLAGGDLDGYAFKQPDIAGAYVLPATHTIYTTKILRCFPASRRDQRITPLARSGRWKKAAKLQLKMFANSSWNSSILMLWYAFTYLFAYYQTQCVTLFIGFTGPAAHGHRRSIKGRSLFTVQKFYSLIHR